MKTTGRRTFLKSSVASLGVAALAGRVWAQAAAGSSALGANDKIRTAVVGLHGRGHDHVDAWLSTPGVELVALCDVDQNVLNKAADAVDKRTGGKVGRVVDIRKLLEDKSLNAISIATPNHWHTLAAFWAMQAGKDVYVEKPLCHNIWEGRQLVKAARKYQRICQHGTQGRSSPALQEAMQKLKEGAIGKVYMARGLSYKWRASIGKAKGPQPIPKGVDYDLWLGPAPEKPLLRKSLHYTWHWFWDYGNGDIGNQGIHEMDMARWGLGVDLPSKIQSMGGNFVHDDDKQTFTSQTVTFWYPQEKKLLEFEVRPWVTNYEGFGANGSNEVGVLFYGTEGYMAVEYFGYKTFLGQKREPGPTAKEEGNPWVNFVKAVRSRKIEDVCGDVEAGFKTCVHNHLANIAARLGRTLTFDPATEQFPGDAEANAMLTREYRKPFVVPVVD